MRGVIAVLVILFGCAGFGLGVYYWSVADDQRTVIADIQQQLTDSALNCDQQATNAYENEVINALTSLQAQTDKLQRRLEWMQTHGVVVHLEDTDAPQSGAKDDNAAK